MSFVHRSDGSAGEVLTRERSLFGSHGMLSRNKVRGGCLAVSARATTLLNTPSHIL